MSKKFVVLLLVLTMLLAACGQPASGDQNVNQTPGTVRTESPQDEVQEDKQEDNSGSDAQTIGALKLTNMGTVTGSPNFVSGDLLVDYVDDGVQILDLNGNATSDKVYEDLHSIIGNGLCVVSQTDASGMELLGVVNAYTGKEIVPCEVVDLLRLSDRYILLCYMTEEGTEDDSYGALYSASGRFYYKGYGLVLDTLTEAIVPNVKSENSMYVDLTAAGQMLFLDIDKYPLTAVYGPDGSLVGEYEYLIPYTNSDLVLQNTEDGIRVFNGDMEEVGTLSGSLYDYDTIDGQSGMMIQHLEDGNDQVIDLKGNVLSKAYARILDVYAGAYVLYSEEDAAGNRFMGVDDFAGNAIIPAEYDNINYCEPGYFICDAADGYFLYDAAGKKINQETMDVQMDDCVLYLGSYEQLLILNTGELLDVSDGYPDHQCLSLVHIGDRLIDVISGEIVMDQLDDCVCTGNNLYVWDEETETFTRYLVEYAG